MRGRTYQNMALTIIAAGLVVMAVDRIGISTVSSAQAQPRAVSTGGMTNALEQRKQMIAELRQMNARLERLEARLNAGANVRVTDMPPLRLPPELMRTLQTPRPADRRAPEAPEEQTENAGN